MGFSTTLSNTLSLTTETHCGKRSRPLNAKADDREESDGLIGPLKKRVKFVTSSGDKIKTTEVESDISHSDLDKPKLWWTRNERAGIIDRCHAAIKDTVGEQS